MARIQVASTTGGSDGAWALAVLTRWTSHYLGRRTRGETQTTPEVLIRDTQTRQLIARSKEFKRGLPFSWLRFLVSLVSLVLVFSDIFRGGLGVSNLEKYYPSLHPDEVLGFGTSWNYSVFAATKEDAYSGKVGAAVWAYKFDSTSISWRAFVRHFGVSDYADCLLYKSQCPGESFDGAIAFRMIDNVVDAVAGLNNSRSVNNFGPVGLTLRTENEYVDRLHQFLLPTWFTNFNWRTNQALYYSPELLSKANARSICFPANGGRVKVPRFCHELWTNLDRSSAPSDTTSRAAGLLYVHTIERLRGIQARFPNATVDLTFLESQEDLQVSRGGLSFTGFRRSDVSTIIRARECVEISTGAKQCDTVFVEDYRYETGLLMSDVVQWYRLVAVLRGFGQSYFWLRGVGLILSCYFAHGPLLNSHKKLSIWRRLRKARRLFMLVPTQCIVYDSSVPIVCYVVAHFLDSPFTYYVLVSHFFSQAGVLSIDPKAFVSYAVVQMRSVWVYALAWHVVVQASALRDIIRTNQMHIGVLGVPEFLLSTLSSVTLVAQHRSTSFRSSKGLQMMVLPNNMGNMRMRLTPCRILLRTRLHQRPRHRMPPSLQAVFSTRRLRTTHRCLRRRLPALLLPTRLRPTPRPIAPRRRRPRDRRLRSSKLL